METIEGKPVTDADILDWADEAERGYDVEQADSWTFTRRRSG